MVDILVVIKTVQLLTKIIGNVYFFIDREKIDCYVSY